MPKKSKKTPDTLQTEYKAKVAHAVDQIDNWTGKLVKAMHSRNHKLTDDQTGKVANAVATIYNEFENALTAEPTKSKEGFKL